MKIDKFLSKTRHSKKVDILLFHLSSTYHLSQYFFNMGLLYIATFLKKHNYFVKCMGAYEIFRMSRNKIKSYLMLSQPCIVGFYTTSENIHWVKSFASMVKKYSPKSKVIVGGPYSTSFEKDILETSSFDVSVLGEGEYPLLKLADYFIKKEGKIEDIPGIIYRKEGKPYLTSPPERIDDLDSLPFPEHSLVERKDWFQIVAGRGCPYRCIFCFQKVHGHYRPRSIKSVVDEIIYNLDSYPYLGFSISDDLFVTDPERIIEFAKLLSEYRKKSKRDFIFYCQGRINILDKYPELIKILKDVGMTRIQVGFESGDAETLKYYKKKITIEQIKNVCRYVAKVGGITFMGNFIVGGPFENKKTVKKTMDLIEELINIGPGVIECTTGYMIPYPGTEISINPSKYGLKVVDNEFLKGSTDDVCMVSDEYDVNGMRSISNQFVQKITSLMESNLKNIPRKLLFKHIEWFSKYNSTTFWFQIVSSRKAIIDYYNLMQIPGFNSFDKIPKDDLLQWFPQRVVEIRKYSRDGKQLILPRTTGEYKLETREEILIYEMSSGKLKTKDLIDRFIDIIGSNLNPDEVFDKYFLPTFEKLDKSYHIAFHQYG